MCQPHSLNRSAAVGRERAIAQDHQCLPSFAPDPPRAGLGAACLGVDGATAVGVCLSLGSALSPALALICARSSLATLKNGTRLAPTLTTCPVRGLRPSRARCSL